MSGNDFKKVTNFLFLCDFIGILRVMIEKKVAF